MEQEKRNILMQRQRERLGGFLADALVMEESEMKAIGGEGQMTQELFDSIADKCIERIGRELDCFFYSFMSEYPEYLNAYMDRAEKIMNMVPAPETEQEPWEKIVKHICPEETEQNSFS